MPKKLHFVWMGGELSPSAKANITEWAAKAAESGWRVRLWTDPKAADAPGNKQLLADLEAQFPGVVGQRPVDRSLLNPVPGGSVVPALDSKAKKLVDLALDKGAYALASDVARYHILQKRGGAYVDVDIAPGQVQLPADPKMSTKGSAVPFLAPLLRDQEALDRHVAELPEPTEADAGKTPTQRVVDKLYDAGMFNNNLIVSPPGSPFLQRLIDNLPKTDDYNVQMAMVGKDLSKNAASLTGPRYIESQLEKHLKANGKWPANTTWADFANTANGHLQVDPEARDTWSNLDFITPESEAQLDRETPPPDATGPSTKTPNFPTADAPPAGATPPDPATTAPKRPDGDQVINDESWRHSGKDHGDPGTSWAKHPAPVSPDRVDAVRGDVPPVRHFADVGGLTNDSRITFGPDGRPKFELSTWGNQIGYEARRIAFPGVDGKPDTVVQDRTFKLFLNNTDAFTPQQIQDFKDNAKKGADTFWNKGFALPRGDQLNVNIEFTTNPDEATGTITITPPGSHPNQLELPVDAKPVHFAHEIGGHSGGLDDVYFERPDQNPSIFQHSPGKTVTHLDGTTEVVGKGRVANDNSIMGPNAGKPEAHVMPRDLWLVDKRGPNPEVMTPSRVDPDTGRVDNPVNPNTTAPDTRADVPAPDVKSPNAGFGRKEPWGWNEPDAPAAVVGGGRDATVPKKLHFVWMGGELSPAAKANITEWAAKAAESGWKLRLWTDPSAAAKPGNRQLLADLEARFPGVVGQRPVDRSLLNPLPGGSVVPGLDSNAKKLSDLALKKGAYALASDIARYHILQKRGGAYVDVDIAPGQVQLPQDLKMSNTGAAVPFLAPLLRDQEAFDRHVAELPEPTEADAGKTPLQRVVDNLYDAGMFNNNLIVSPPDSQFLQRLIDNLPKPDDYSVQTALVGKDLSKNAASLTGPRYIESQLEKHLKANGKWPPNTTWADFSNTFNGHLRVDPEARATWSGLDFITPESEAQLDRETPPAADTGGPSHKTPHFPGLRNPFASTPAPMIPLTTLNTARPGPLLPSLPALPEFAQSGRALGSVAARDVTGAARVTDAVNGLLPRRPGVEPVGVDAIESAITGDFESVLGNGRHFQVQVGRDWFDAHVQAVMTTPVDEAAATSTPPTKTKVDMAANSGVTASATSTIASGNDVGVAAAAGMGVGVTGSLGAKAPLARPVTSTTTTTSAADQRIIRSGDNSTRATVPVTYTVTLTDARGTAHGPVTVASDPAGDVDVTLHIPHELTSLTPPDPALTPVTPAPGWGARLEHPVPEAVTGLDAARAFADIAAHLHPSITQVGSPGRTTVLDFVNETSIRDNFGPMLSGWVTSPDLVSPHGGHASALQMRANLITAELVGTTNDSQLRVHETSGTSGAVSASTKSGFDISAGLGGGAIVPGAVGGTAGVVGGVSARTTESSSAGVSTSTRAGIQLKNEIGLYKVTAEVEVRTPNGANVVIPVTTYQRIGVPEAAAQGLPVPPGTAPDLTKPGTAGTRFAPPYLAASLAAGNAKVGAFEPAARVKTQVEDALRRLGGFLPTWNAPNADPRTTRVKHGDLVELMANQRKLDAEISRAALSGRMDSLMGSGVQVQLKKRGFATNEYVNIRIKANVAPGTHVGQVDGRNVRGSASTGPRLDSSTATQKGWNLGVEGRVVIPAVSGTTTLTPAPQAGVKFSSSTTAKTTAGPTVNSTSLNVGSADAQVFDHNTTFDVEITTFSRSRAWVRRVTPGSPFREVPAPRTVARTGGGANVAQNLPPIAGPVTLWVSDGSTLDSDPSVFAPGTPTATPIANPGSIKDLLSAPRPAAPEILHVEAVVNTDAVVEEAIRVLNQAADGDSSLTVPGTESRNRINQSHGAESFKANLPKLIRTGMQEGSLKYGRRVTDRTGALGTSVELRNPRLVSISDSTPTENASTGGYKAGTSKTDSKSVDATVGVNVPMKPTTTPKGAGGLGWVGKWTPWARSSTRSNEVAGSVDRNRVTAAKTRTVLVQMDADVTLIAESRSGNTLYKGTPRTAGSVVTLPGGVFVRVSEDTARGMGLLPPLPGHTSPTFGSMEPPRMLAQDEPGALGLSLVDEMPDLSTLVPDLRADLRRLGPELLPESVLDDSMHNLQRLVDLASTTGATSLVDSALDGGVPLLVHKPGVFGKETFQVVLRATTGTPVFRNAVNDGVDMEHTVATARKTADTREKSTAWGTGLRLPGVGQPGSANPNLSGTAGVAAAVNIGGAKTTSTTTSTTDQAGNLRAGTGPAVRYGVPIRFELVVEKGDHVVGRASSGPREMGIRVHADNQRVTPPTGSPARTPYTATDVRRDAAEARPDRLTAWRAAGNPVTLPPGSSVETLRGVTDLRRVAVTALTAAGANAGITGKGTGSLNALLSTISSEQLQPGLPGMTGSPLVVGLDEASLTLSQHADLEVYPKLVNPRLAAVSDGVKLENPTTSVTATSTDFKSTETGDASLGAVAGGFSLKQPQDPANPKPTDPVVNFNTGGVEVRHATENSDAVSGGASANRTGNLKADGRTGLVAFDVEYRVVARLDNGGVAVFDLTVPDSAEVRMTAPDVEAVLGKALDGPLAEAQNAVKTEAELWRKAEEASDAARHAAVAKINELAPDITRADNDVATRAGELTTAATTAATAAGVVPGLETALERAKSRREQANLLVDTRQGELANLRVDAVTVENARLTAELHERMSADAVADARSRHDLAAQRLADAEADLRTAEQALANHTPPQGPDPRRPVLETQVADAKALRDARQRDVDTAHRALTDAQADHQVAAATAQQAQQRATAVRQQVTDAETLLNTALTTLGTARTDVTTAEADLVNAQDAARRADQQRVEAQERHDAAVRARQQLSDEIARVEQALEAERVKADQAQQAWWDAKAQVDQQIDTYNATPPPPPPAPPAPPTNPTTAAPANAAPTNATQPQPHTTVAAPTLPTTPPVPPLPITTPATTAGATPAVATAQATAPPAPPLPTTAPAPGTQPAAAPPATPAPPP
ncbi:glycosyltransferase, partial [Saccharothrix hoggarensis]